MRKLTVFNQISLDGFFVDKYGDMSWAHNLREDKEWAEFVSGNANSGGVLVFGRITYELMAGFWPTPEALKSNPVVAAQMNKLEKIVISRTMKKADWENTKVINENMEDEFRHLKKEKGADMVIMGSGSIVAQLTEARLIDEYHVVIVPVIVGKGRTMFEGVAEKVKLKLNNFRTFANGNVFLQYGRE